MVAWFNRWQRWFGKPQGASGAAPDFWNLTHSNPLRWNLAETGILLQCERNNVFCSVVEEPTGESRQTVVLGFDLDTNQLLLDEFFPRPAHLVPGQRLQLNLPSTHGLLVLSVIMQDPILVTTTPAYVVEVMEKQLLRDRRVHPRVEFAGSSAPKVEMLLPLTPSLRGQLVDLSASGFSMWSVGAHKPALFSRNGHCRIHFADQFVLSVDVRLQQVRFRRRPCHHTVFRARFCQLADAERDRLQAFIRSYAALAN